MNIETVSEFCLYCKKRLQYNEQNYHNKCHEESKEFKKQFDNFIEIDGHLYWKDDWKIEQKLHEWAEKTGNVTIYIDYSSFKDDKSNLEILFVHDLRIINKSTENIPNILFFKGVEYIYLFFSSRSKTNTVNYTIPKSILTLKSLKGLWIDNIQERDISNKNKNIHSISGSVDGLVNLERLFLLYEGAIFPKGLKNLKNLKELTVGNAFTSNKIIFSNELLNLPKLKIVSCGFIEPTERLGIVK